MEIQPSSSSADSISQLHIDIGAADKKWFPSRRWIHKVSSHLRNNRRFFGEPSVYDPVMVSLGPYHHRKEEFKRAEEFKLNCLHWCTNGSDEVKRRFYDMVFSKIDEIRDCYAEVSIVKEYDDNALTLMMLLDACFIINFMEIPFSIAMAKHWYACLGVAATIPFACRDIMVLENQIPFFVLKLLISEMYDKERGGRLLSDFLDLIVPVETFRTTIPKEDEDPPIHILDACHRMLCKNAITSHPYKQCSISFCVQRKDYLGGIDRSTLLKQNDLGIERSTWISRQIYRLPDYHVTCPSATYLKAKGIRISPSSSLFINDIKFKSYAFYGQLQLPICHVSDINFGFISNAIAYELAPDNEIDFSVKLVVLSYANLMKSLIQTPSDVIELQEKGILRFSRFTNLEQVVQLFKRLDTFNLRNPEIYHDVLNRVREHCNSKTKTWMAELIHSKLKSPWTIIALLYATLLLILAFLQTYFTMHPVK